MVFCEEWGPSISMLIANFALAIVNILLKKILNEGISHLLVVTYRQAISAVFLIPIAYFWEKKCRPKLTASTACYLFVSALIGGTLTQYFFLLGLKYTSATFTCAFINLVPVITFIMALIFGLEKLNMKSNGGRAKVLGTTIAVVGALILTLYKGIPLIRSSTYSQDHVVHVTNHHANKRWAIGTVSLAGGSIAWSSWYLMQVGIGKKYPCQYSSTAIISFFGAIQSAILCLIIDRNASWVVTGALEISSIVYAVSEFSFVSIIGAFYLGMVGSGLCYVVMAWCVKQRGPVFTAAFTPFIQLFVAIFDISILREQIHLGSVLGSVIVVIGMYILLWGKSDEAKRIAIKPVQAPEDEEGGNNTQLSSVIPVANTLTASS